MTKSIAVIGLGKLGLPLAASLANANYNVIGVDKNEHIVEILNNPHANVESICKNEVDLSSMIVKNRSKLRASNSIDLAVKESDVIFVVVPTPSLDSGAFDMQHVENVAKDIGIAMIEDHKFKTIVLVSTVLPGNTQNSMIDIIERDSQKIHGVDFAVCYSPTMIALGRVIHDLLYPNIVMIGSSCHQAASILSEIYNRMCQRKDLCVKTSGIQMIELIKISMNVFITMKMAYAMTLSKLCEMIPGGNIDEAVDIIGSDPRIGKRYMKVGLAYGGPCFPRDNRAFSSVARKMDAISKLSQATDSTNILHNSLIFSKIENILHIDNCIDMFAGRKIAVLGLTYKPDTNVVEESAAWTIANSLAIVGANVVVYDPSGAGRDGLPTGVAYANSAQECILDTELAIIAVDWKEFVSLTPEFFVENMEKPTILDCWRIYDPSLFEQNGVSYYCIGRYGYC